MKLSELNPDVVLSTLLDGNVRVRTSETESHAVKCYPAGKMPNKNLDDEYLTVRWNGSAQSITNRNGFMEGNLALRVWCAMQTDNTIKTNRVRDMISQCEEIINGLNGNGVSAGGFFFTLDSTTPITPTSTRMETGYSVTILNVVWRNKPDKN